MTAQPEITGSLCKFETCPDWVPAMDSCQQFAWITLKTMPAHGFDHCPVWAAKVRNVSRLGSQFSISVPPLPFFPCFVCVAWLDTRSFWNGGRRVVSNPPCFHVAFSTRSLRSRRCSLGGWLGNADSSN